MNIRKGLRSLSSSAFAVILAASCAVTAYAEPTDEEPFISQSSIVQTSEETSEVSYTKPDEQYSHEQTEYPTEPEESDDQSSEEVSVIYEESYVPQVSEQEYPQESEYEQSSYVYQESSYITEYSGGTTYVVDGSSYEYSSYPQYVYDNDNDNYTETYEEYHGDDDYSYEPQEPERDTSSLDISDYELSDTKVLTSEDWEELKRSAQGQNSTFEFSVSPIGNNTDAFKKLKEESSGGNDDWVFLVWGIVLIGVGAVSIGAVIASNVISKKKRR